MPKETMKETIKRVVNEEDANSNKGTLKPKSKESEPMPKLSNKKDVLPNVEDDENLGTGPVKPGDKNPDSTGAVKKDTSKSSVASVGSEPMKKLQEELTEEILDYIIDALNEEIDEEEILENLKDALSEETLDFIKEESLKVVLADLVEEVDEEEEMVEEAPTFEPVDPEDIEIDMTEDVNAMFNGEDLSEEFKAKAKTIFESAVKVHVADFQNRLYEEYQDAVLEGVEEVTQVLAEQLEDAVDYVSEQWLKDNEVAIESSLRSELTEEFISGLFQLCTEMNIDLPENKIDIVEELTEKVQELEEQLNEQIETNVAMTADLKEAAKQEAFAELTEGLSDVQKEKLHSLVENVEFETDDELFEKVKTLRESYFPSNVKPQERLEESAEEGGEPIVEEKARSPLMQSYLDAIKRTNPK